MGAHEGIRLLHLRMMRMVSTGIKVCDVGEATALRVGHDAIGRLRHLPRAIPGVAAVLSITFAGVAADPNLAIVAIAISYTFGRRSQ